MSRYKIQLLEDLVDLKQGFAINAKSNHYISPDNNGIPLLRITDLIQNKQEVYIKHSIPKQFISDENDIIFTRTGQVGLTLRNRKGVVHNNCFTVKSISDKLDDRYLFWALNNEDFRSKAISVATGFAQPDLSHGAFKSLRVFLPNIDEQKKIAHILDMYERLTANNNHRITTLEEMSQRLYREWFVHFRFPGHENVKMVESELGLIPEGWDIGVIADTITPQRKNISRQLLSDDTLYIGLEHIPRKKIIISEYSSALSIKSSKLLFDEGNVLFGKIRPYFHKIAIAPFSGCCSTDIIVLQLDQLRYAFDYLTLFTDGFISYTTQISQGTKMPRAEWSVIKDYKIISPEVQVINSFNEIVYPLIVQMKSLSKRNNILHKTRDLLLPRLISGDIDVSNIEIPISEVSQ